MSSTPTTKKFTAEDTEKLVSLLNFVATNAKFDGMDVKKILQFTKLLNWSQTELLPKVEANVFEVLEVREVKPEKKSK